MKPGSIKFSIRAYLTYTLVFPIIGEFIAHTYWNPRMYCSMLVNVIREFNYPYLVVIVYARFCSSKIYGSNRYWSPIIITIYPAAIDDYILIKFSPNEYSLRNTKMYLLHSNLLSWCVTWSSSVLEYYLTDILIRMTLFLLYKALTIFNNRCWY